LAVELPPEAIRALVWRYYDTEAAPADLPLVPWDDAVVLFEFDGGRFRGSEAVRQRLVERANWRRQVDGRDSSWTFEQVVVNRVLALRLPEGKWPPEPEVQPSCVLIEISPGEIVEIQEFRSLALAIEGLERMGLQYPST
jgi:hypothetical protein